MSAADIRLGLHQIIEGLDTQQLREAYALLQNFLGRGTEEWNELPKPLQQKILQGISEADNENTKPYKAVTNELRHKYGLNG